jgi:1-aminocyclopropane-1-carboxylate deaminase/D-cysteine desulfhydrase-like pyridoxal-dependent ACC family enzyme
VSRGLRAALRALPRRPLAALPTPLEPAPRLGARFGLELWVKREDQSGLGLGGNKARQVEVLLADALERGAEVVLTTASAQSNFCRVLAAGAARLGLHCILLLRGAGGQPAARSAVRGGGPLERDRRSVRSGRAGAAAGARGRCWQAGADRAAAG